MVDLIDHFVVIVYGEMGCKCLKVVVIVVQSVTLFPLTYATLIIVIATFVAKSVGRPFRHLLLLSVMHLLIRKVCRVNMHPVRMPNEIFAVRVEARWYF